MFHAIVDFQMHILPVLLMAGIAAGLVLGPGGKGRRRQGRPIVHGLLVLATAVLAVVAAGREALNSPGWLQFEVAALESRGQLSEKDVANMKKLIEASPHYSAARTYGGFFYANYGADPENGAEFLEEAHWALAIAYERNPYDQASAGNFGLVLDLLGKHEEATPVYRRAVEMSWRRENKFGAMAAMAHHLYARGYELWMKRKPEEALGYFLLSQQYLSASLKAGFRYENREEFFFRKGELEKGISILQNAGLKPRFPAGIAPPPKDS